MQLKKKKMRRPDKFGNYGAEIKSYVRVIRKASGKVKRTVAALGILRQKPPHLLQPGRNVVTKAWASSVLKRIKFVKRKSTKAAKKFPADAQEEQREFLVRICL